VNWFAAMDQLCKPASYLEVRRIHNDISWFTCRVPEEYVRYCLVDDFVIVSDFMFGFRFAAQKHCEIAVQLIPPVVSIADCWVPFLNCISILLLQLSQKLL
jgi:hypothetical protein